MASILRKSLKNQFLSAARILSSKPTPTSPPLFHHPSSSRVNQIPYFHQGGTSDSNLNVGFFYPSFSFGHFLNPVCSNGLITSEEDNVDDESNKIWADSVKKKRKRKMNKHKLKKLRKRLRRKT